MPHLFILHSKALNYYGPALVWKSQGKSSQTQYMGGGEYLASTVATGVHRLFRPLRYGRAQRTRESIYTCSRRFQARLTSNNTLSRGVRSTSSTLIMSMRHTNTNLHCVLLCNSLVHASLDYCEQRSIFNTGYNLLFLLES